MIRKYTCWILGVLAGHITGHAFGQPAWMEMSPESMAMSRSKMYLEDNQVILFNGRGSVSPRQFSVTGLTNLKFYPVDLPDYEFCLEFYHHRSETTINDNTPELWKTWLETGRGTDPLGANLRPEFKKLIVTQDEVWQPNQYYRKGVFHYRERDELLSFGVESRASVSGATDEVYLQLKLKNYGTEHLDMTLIPVQQIRRVDSAAIQKDGPFKMIYGDTRITIGSDIRETDQNGFRISVPAGETGEYYFVIQIAAKGAEAPPVFQTDAANRFDRADRHTRERLDNFARNLPRIKTQHHQLNELYKRCALSVAECKWERGNFIISPFWASGTWPISMIWDQCFSADVLSMVDPNSVKETVKLSLRECKMERSWLFWHGPLGDIVYIQDPFAIQATLDTYITHTGDRDVLMETTGGKTVYEWLKQWAEELHGRYAREDGLIDVGPKGEQLIEMRTYGYNDVVPVVSVLASDYYGRLHQWALEVGDHEAPPYLEWSNEIRASLEKLWNDDNGWFDILRPDGGRETIWSYHLFEVLESNSISSYQAERLAQHIVDGEFLAPYGLYSISIRDTMHWDRIDGDWGGGGQYAGMPLKIAKSLFKRGYSHQAYEILKRFARYTEHFPYISQNPWSDKMFQDQSSMPLQISAGAGVEAILSGVFGLLPQLDGRLVINPSFDREVGYSELTGYQYRNHRYDVILFHDHFTVKRDGRVIATRRYGEAVVCNPGF